MSLTRVNSAGIENGTITNAHLHPSAAISGDKINPDFGSQNVITTGTVTATSFSGNGANLTNIPGFASGTLMLFVQTSAPTGWTKSTTHDDKALRVVSGAASSGGSTAFTSVFASRTPSGSVSGSNSGGSVSNTTLSTSQMPSHTHTTPGALNSAGAANIKLGSTGNFVYTTSTATGGGGSHNHGFTNPSWSGSFTGTAMDFAVQYVDVIIATKD